MPRFSPRTLISSAFATVRAAGVPLLAVVLLAQVLTFALVSPVLDWLFREALRANGMLALDLTRLPITGGLTISVALIIAILLLAFWAAALQAILLVHLLERARTRQPIAAAAVWADVRRTVRKLVRPSSFPLFLYLFVILPLSGFGFVSVLAQGITVPAFISGELMKSTSGSILWIAFIALIALLNLRFALSLPVFALTSATGGRAMRASWRLTGGWAALRLILAAFATLVAATIASLVLITLALAPTQLADTLAPTAAPFVAAFSLGAAQVAGLVIVSLVNALLCAITLALLAERRTALPMFARSAPPAPAEGTAPVAGPGPRTRRRRGALALLGGTLVAALGLGILHIDTMTRLSQHPSTLVFGHRGFTDGGVENTIGALEAAAAAGADLVEIDALQTADRQFVVMHDASLARLAGKDLFIKDLTLAEATRLTVRDQLGHAERIPSLEEYVTRAAELEMPLLIEVKLGGLDSPDLVDLLLADLERFDALETNIFHSLDYASVERLKRLRPDTTVGYIMALAGVDVPATSADFIVVEEWSATEEMQAAAARAGLGFLGWTVNEETGMRELLRRDITGIITDHPDRAVAVRAEMQGETGLAGTLLDALTRFVVVF